MSWNEQDMRYFVLDGHRAVEVPAREQWDQWMRMHVKERVVCRTKIGKRYHIVTVFTGRADDHGDPGIFSTAVFSRKYNEPTMVIRWGSWEDSEVGHDIIVLRAKIRNAVEDEHGGPCS